MCQKDAKEQWKLDIWMERINKVEVCVASIAEQKKSAHDIDNILIRNYGRIALCLREVLVLLCHGYPDGALSIARTVYEINILTQFIYSKFIEGNSQELIERYFADHNVKAYRNLKRLHEDISQTPDVPKLWKEKAKDFDGKLKELKSQYGKINEEYWWANICFNGKRTTFSMIDEEVNEDYLLRMIYKRACIGIHASAMGAFALLGRENGDGNIIYTSQTDKGFESPLLLGMISHDCFVEILCDYWKIDKTQLICDMNTTYQEYIGKCLLG